MTAPLLTIRDLSVIYDRWGSEVHALQGINLNLFLGEWVMLAGPNGAGKSTLLRAISGEVSYGGEIRFENRVANARSQCYGVQQNPIVGTSSSLTVLENLWLIDEAPPRRRPGAVAKYANLLTALNLSKKLEHPVESLSGGERQILAVFMGTLTTHPLILLDEPTAALDPLNEQYCLSLMGGIRKAGRTLLHVSHKVAQHQFADRVVLLEGGQLAPNAIAPPTNSRHVQSVPLSL